MDTCVRGALTAIAPIEKIFLPAKKTIYILLEVLPELVNRIFIMLFYAGCSWGGTSAKTLFLPKINATQTLISYIRYIGIIITNMVIRSA